MSIMEMDNHQSPFRLWIMVVVKKYIDDHLVSHGKRQFRTDCAQFFSGFAHFDGWHLISVKIE